MGNVLRVFIRDLKRLAKAPAAWVVALFLIVLPSLYAWINVYGFWNPYDNTQNLAVCVVNEDAGVKDKLLGHLDLGDQIVDDLRENDQMGWEFADRDQAMAAVESGRAYAAFVIPRSFSADVAALASGRLEQAQIEYYVNEKTGPVAPKIMDKGATTLDTTINSAFVSQVSSTVVEALEGTSAEVKQEVAEKATASFERVDKAIDTLGGIRDSLGTLEDTAESAQRKSADARTSLADEKKSIEGLADDLDRMADLVAEANESSARLSQQLGNALDTGGQALSLAASQTNL
ncbi:MAG: YhgE/Pip family protein, partial [Coriobacteriaceae bacterium]|nr:YhgE/Pip family protein [Coriobacteriaceae bacterium]